MSRKSTGSTSSTPTPGSWADVAKLGEYILDQLGRDHRSDNLLVHWVAHRLAEHMRTAETADDPGERDAARDAAALLIAKLWQARGGWPRGWPPDAAREFVDAVRHTIGHQYGEQVGRLPPWLSTFVELEALHREELAAWLNAALLEVGVDELRRAVEAAPDDAPEPQDLSDIRWQLRRHENAEEWIEAQTQEDEDPSRRADRARVLGRVLQDIAERRRALIERTLNDARRGQRRKPSLQGTRITPRSRRASQRRSGE